jgi:hypothetical protein
MRLYANRILYRGGAFTQNPGGEFCTSCAINPTTTVLGCLCPLDGDSGRTFDNNGPAQLTLGKQAS